MAPYLGLVRLRGTLLLAAALACTPQTPSPSAAPALAVRAALQTVILQPADVPADYVIEKDEAMSPDDLANGLGTTPAELKQRLAFGYVRSFTKGGDPLVCCVIDSILITTADVVDAVEVTGRAGSFERAYVLELAKKQLQRLRADAEKR